MKLICCILVLLVLNGLEGAKILGIFPTPSISHQVVFHSLMKGLADRGHQLTILTPDLINIQNPNVTQINLHNSYEVFRKEFNFVAIKESKSDEADLMESFMPISIKIIDDQLSHPEVKKIIKKGNQKFDLVIVEHLNYAPMLAFAELYDCPIIGITSLDTFSAAHESFGNEANPVLHPEILFSYTHGQLTFAERWKSLKYYFRFRFIVQPKFNRHYTELIKKHFPTVKTPINEITNRVQLLMTNTHPAMGFIRPLLPNTIQLGFMHIEPPKPLPNSELKKFLDNSEKGVIYMSLGSNVQSKDLSSEILQNFLQVFGSLSYNVLWKFEEETLPNKPDHVMISKWLPQADLLAHPSIKLFITQGGQQSMEEAIDRTVPMVVIPFLGDQDSNAKRMEQRGIGLHLELHSLTQLKLIGAINEMMKPKYKENIKKLRELVYDEPMTSRNRAVWWTEYIIRHKGAKHLQYSGRNVPFFKRYWLDIISIALLVATIFILTLREGLKKIFFTKKIKSE